MSLITPIIICGGSGTRLWPESRENQPKQFIALFGENSSFQNTLLRVNDPKTFTKPVIIGGYAHRFLMSEQAAKIGVDVDILLEPKGRDSAPAIVAATLFAARKYDHPTVLVLASDHHIVNVEGFLSTVKTAAQGAKQGKIVTFGIKPDAPATGYGYIEKKAGAGPVYDIARFVEKPDEDAAKKHIANGLLWNSGNFIFPSALLLKEYKAHDDESYAIIERSLNEIVPDLNFEPLSPTFLDAKAISIDYAVMEKTKNAAVVDASFDWSDIGSWGAVAGLSAQDGDGNSTLGEVKFYAAHNNLVRSHHPLVALAGVDNLAVIATRDVVLVTKSDGGADLKALVKNLQAEAHASISDHARVRRPWGDYESLDIGSRHQVKRITVKPEGRLSLQKHFHRSEHWVVVKGIALVTIDDKETLLEENHSVYIPLGSVHRLENPGKIDLELIEVQTGSYLGEDDIVRLEDVYGRS